MEPTIFHESWWLDIATEGRYSVAEVVASGRVVGRLPYTLCRKFGIIYATLPPLTYFIGPAVDTGEGSASRRHNKYHDITRELISKLPPTHFFKIKCQHGVPDVLAFQENKFHSSVQFTYEIPPGSTDEVWKNMRQKARRQIRAGQDRHVVAPLEDPPEFIRFYQKNLDAQGKKSYMALDVCGRLIEACLARGRGRIWAARDKTGALAAAVFCPWDASASYYLMTTRAPESDHTAVSAPIWESIKDAMTRGLMFDFEGVGNAGSVPFFAGFGGTVSPRYVVTRAHLPIRLFFEMRNRLRENSWFS